ncbi:MAG: family 16 glycosylhydrolase [Alphaproteobacteria bacterium]|nr:family 16 glycosylhydrolase [Alphaproteobacteria bacterium]
MRFLRQFLLCLVVVFSFAGFEAKAGDIPFFAQYPHFDLGMWAMSHGGELDKQSCEWRRENVEAKDGHVYLHLREKPRGKKPVGCAELKSRRLIADYGFYEARMRTASGSGLNTAFFTYTGPPFGVPDHDEIDFEFLGKDPMQVEVNYHRKGRNMGPWKIDLGFDASEAFHDYAFEWSPDKIKWFVDGKLVFETPDGADVPKHAGKLYFSLWANTRRLDAWMGPFQYQGPVTAEVEWVRYTPSEKYKAVRYPFSGQR